MITFMHTCIAQLFLTGKVSHFKVITGENLNKVFKNKNDCLTVKD